MYDDGEDGGNSNGTDTIGKWKIWCSRYKWHTHWFKLNPLTARCILFALKFERDDTNVMTSACAGECVRCWTRIIFGPSTTMSVTICLFLVSCVCHCFLYSRSNDFWLARLSCLTVCQLVVTLTVPYTTNGFFLIAYLFRGKNSVDLLIIIIIIIIETNKSDFLRHWYWQLDFRLLFFIRIGMAHWKITDDNLNMQNVSNKLNYV